MRLSKNFQSSEFKCSHCGDTKMDKEFISKLQELRTLCNFPFKINSGWRCDEHNKKVSKNSRGDHVLGTACDVHCVDRYKRFSILQHAISLGYFKDIAISKTFIHLGRGNVKNGVGVYG